MKFIAAFSFAFPVGMKNLGIFGMALMGKRYKISITINVVPGESHRPGE